MSATQPIPICRLANGVALPRVGFGTWRIPDGDACVQAVSKALALGYRHVDTATAYGNEASVGEALRGSGLRREQVFVTSKVAPEDLGYQSTLEACQRSLERLRLDQLDLYLIHWPASPSRQEDWVQVNLETWRAMMELYRRKLVRAIGVSNFWPHHLQALLETEVKPMVNQIEHHPGVYHRDLIQHCVTQGILVEGYSPLATGEVLRQPTLGVIARKYGRTTAQICLRWAIQQGVVPLPKTVHAWRMEENLNVWNFSLTPEEMNHISDLPFCGGKNHHPDRR